jgi:hypothetical protein
MDHRTGLSLGVAVIGEKRKPTADRRKRVDTLLKRQAG